MSTAAQGIGRRAVLASGVALGALGTLGGGKSLASDTAQKTKPASYLVPGYRAEAAVYRGLPASEAPELRKDFPAGYEGGITLLTRIDERDGALRRALLPITGHHVAVSADKRAAVFSSMNGPGFLVLDPGSLAVVRTLTCHSPDFIAGGHSIFDRDGKILISTERKRYDLPAGAPEQRHGRLMVRDAKTFQVLAAYSSHGIGPHDVRLAADGKHAVIANYGTVNKPKDGEQAIIVEPCVTVLDLNSGKLVSKLVSPVADGEIRHLVADRLDRIAAVSLRMANGAEARALAAVDDSIDESDPALADGIYYKPCPLVRFDAAAESRPTISLPLDPRLARYGQSMVYDPLHDEIVVAYASSHALAVFDGATGAIKRSVRTDRLGLRFPRGIKLHPDGEHYAVSGGWQGIYLFRRGAHSPVLERALHAVFFEHSHLTVLSG